MPQPHLSIVIHNLQYLVESIKIMNTSSNKNPLVNQEPGSRKLIVSMAVAGFISGFIIIAIYLLTFDTIKENKARELREAVFEVLPGVERMQKLLFIDNKLAVIQADGMDDNMLFAGYDQQGKFIGYAIQGKGPGFQDTIQLLYGYLPSKQIMTSMKVLDSRETPGLGDKIYKDKHFVNEFKNHLMKHPIKAVKKGKKTKDYEIDAITGATISSKAVVRIMNQAFATWKPKISTSRETMGHDPVLQSGKRNQSEEHSKEQENTRTVQNTLRQE